MTKVAAIAACMVLATPALAQSMAEKTGVNSALGVAPTTQDFIREAAISDMFEIQSGQLAKDKGDDSTKKFAEEMVTDHQKTSDELKSLVQDGKVQADIPTALDDSHQSMLDKLKNDSSGDFTKDYRDDQVSAHKDAVSLFHRYAKKGDNADLKHWAKETLPVLKHHLQEAKELDNES